MLCRSHSTIRSRLTCLVLAAVLPVWLVSGFLVFHAYSVKRDHVNRNMLETARSLTMVVDRELASVQAALLALATSPTFASGDFSGVHRQTLELLKAYPGADIIVADVTGQQLVNSYRPYGDSLPKRKSPATVSRVFETGKPVISDLYYGAVTRRPMIGVDVPVFRDGKVAYDLAMTFPSDCMASILREQKLSPDWYASILDSKQILVARSSNSDRFVGRRVNPALRRAMMLTPEGTTEAPNLEGTPVFATFCRSSMSRWSVVTGVPKATVMAEIYQWLGLAIAGSTVISLFGIALALGFAQRIAQDIQSLVTSAQSLGRGELLAASGTYCVKEAGTVSEALVQASALLQVRARELAQSHNSLGEEMAERQRSEARFRSLFEQSLDGVFFMAPDGTFLDANPAACGIFGITTQELCAVGRAGIIDHNDPNLSKLLELRDRNGPIFTELTCIRNNGERFPAEVSSVIVSDDPPRSFVIIRDITERKRVEEKLRSMSEKVRALSVHLMTVQEQERISIARDIHDDLGQSLTVLKLDLEMIELRIPAGSSGLKQAVVNMRKSIDQIVSKIQQIAADLRPPLLDSLGLAAAIGWQVKQFKKRSYLEFFLMLNEDVDTLDQKTSTVVMRIVQEGLTNIVRHARATEVSISLCKRDRNLILEISDNGCGITSEQMASPKAYGLLGMLERARGCQGDLEIIGNLEGGTTLCLSIPLETGERAV
jgi:PAS domain S-box-containing protein